MCKSCSCCSYHIHCQPPSVPMAATFCVYGPQPLARCRSCADFLVHTTSILHSAPVHAGPPEHEPYGQPVPEPSGEEGDEPGDEDDAMYLMTEGERMRHEAAFGAIRAGEDPLDVHAQMHEGEWAGGLIW